MTVRVYHNPRCSKSRQTLALLEERGIEPEIIEYLSNPPDRVTLKAILGALGTDISALIRRGESEYKDSSNILNNMDENELIDWLIKHPRVIQRPIVVTNLGARIGRPPESVLEVLD